MMPSYSRNPWSCVFFIVYLSIELYFIMNLVSVPLGSTAVAGPSDGDVGTPSRYIPGPQSGVVCCGIIKNGHNWLCMSPLHAGSLVLSDPGGHPLALVLAL